MESLGLLAVLACPLGMLAMGAIAWAVGKRAGDEPDRAARRVRRRRRDARSAVNAG